MTKIMSVEKFARSLNGRFTDRFEASDVAYVFKTLDDANEFVSGLEKATGMVVVSRRIYDNGLHEVHAR